MFLPASDIPSFVGKGNVDLGITGHDVILEAKMESNITEIQKLGFGKCALQVQVPESGSIKTVDDLAGKRVVTSFEVLAGKYFGEIDERLGIEGENKTKIEYVGGSVEAACALGLADGIGMFFFPLTLYHNLVIHTFHPPSGSRRIRRHNARCRPACYLHRPRNRSSPH